MNTLRTTPVEFAPLSQEFARDPYPIYAALRGQPQLQYFAAYDMWLVPWHKDVSTILSNPDMVRSLDHQIPAEEIAARQVKDNWHDMPYHSRFVQFSMLDSDGATHDRLRSLIATYFGPSAIHRIEASVRAFVDQQLGELADANRIEFVEDFAAHIPGRAIGALMGVPAEDCALLRAWSERIVQFFDIDRSDEKKELAERTTRDFYLYLKQLESERRRQPADDLLSRLVGLQDRGLLTEDEFISTCMLIVMAGHGSTLDVLASGLHTLLRFPGEMNRLRADPGLMGTAVQEMFRFESPLPFFHRYARQDASVHGQEFRCGTRFGLLYGSANRDPTIFAEPDTFDVARRPNRHKAFGGGAHFCLGNHLARLNMDIVFTSLLQRFETIDLVSDPEYKRGLSVRGPKTLEISCSIG